MWEFYLHDLRWVQGFEKKDRRVGVHIPEEPEEGSYQWRHFEEIIWIWIRKEDDWNQSQVWIWHTQDHTRDLPLEVDNCWGRNLHIHQVECKPVILDKWDGRLNKQGQSQDNWRNHFNSWWLIKGIHEHSRKGWEVWAPSPKKRSLCWGV